MQKMEIDATFLLNNLKTGIGAYLNTLFKVLKINKQEYDILDFKLPKFIKYKYLFYILWLNTINYIRIHIKKPDIIFNPSFMTPCLTRKATKYITVIHDLAAFRTGEMTKYESFIYKTAILSTIKHANTIVTVSETVKQELINKFNLTPSRIKVVYNSVADYFKSFDDNTAILEKNGLRKEKYILSVATLNKRKNIPELIKAFESISDKYSDLKLVLVGGMGNEQRKKLTAHPNIIFMGYIKDEEIPILYKHALLYVFPSIYEGFGTPLIEAQYSHCPVLCSNIPVFREIVGQSADFCEPNAKNIAEKIEYLINSSERRNELIKLGIENVKRFDIEKISEQLKEVISCNG